MAATEKWCKEVETMEQMFLLNFLGSETIAICVNSLFSKFSVTIIFIYNGIYKAWPGWIKTVQNSLVKVKESNGDHSFILKEINPGIVFPVS